MKKPMRFASIVLLIGIVISIVAICLGGRVTSVPVFNGTDISDSYVGVKSVDIDLNFSQAQIKIGDEFKIEANNVSKNRLDT